MVGSGKGLFWSEYGYTPFLQAIECLRACYFMDVMLIDVQDIRSSFNRVDYMRVPYLVKKCFLFHF